jgi:hypothetical protein
MFSKSATKKATVATTAVVSAIPNVLTSADPDVTAFYSGLTPNEIIAHTIAFDKLGTSYDVTRTHGFLRWKASRK